MKTCGIVAEYNPFHKGHIYQIQKAKEMADFDCVIVVMSGNFVQRGQPAITDKWQRAKEAVINGADVVIELPYIYATQAATQFSHGAITLLKLAEIDYLSFGSECGNLENLKEIASTPIHPDHLHESLDRGMSYPKAYSLLTSAMCPNDILAVAYLKEIQDTNIQPLLVQRNNDYLGLDLDGEYASAHAIRQAIYQHKDVSEYTSMKIDEEACVTLEDFYPYLRTLLLTTPSQRLEETFLVSEGIHTMLKNNADQNDTLEGFLESSTNYRYTKSRIQRTCLQILNQITKQEVQRLTELNTLRILAFNDIGKSWLHQMQKKEISIASKFSQVPLLYREMEYKTTLLYTSTLKETLRQKILAQEIQGAQYIQEK